MNEKLLNDSEWWNVRLWLIELQVYYECKAEQSYDNFVCRDIYNYRAEEIAKFLKETSVDKHKI